MTPFPPWCLCVVSTRTLLHPKNALGWTCGGTHSTLCFMHRNSAITNMISQSVSMTEVLCVSGLSHAAEDADGDHVHLKTVRGLSRKICTWRDWLCGPKFHELQQYRGSSRPGNVAVAVSLPARTCHRFYKKVLGLAAWSFSTLRPKIASLTPQLPSKGSNN